MTRHGRPTDRKLVGELLDRLVARAKQLDDRPPVGVPEGVEWISGSRAQCDSSIVTFLLP
jgi:hypothetical protein